MNRKYLSLAALAGLLVALGVVLLPFSAEGSSCSPAALSAWQTHRVLVWASGLDSALASLDTTTTTSTPTTIYYGWQGQYPSTAGTSYAPPPASQLPPATFKSVPTSCAVKARPRLESSGVLLGLTLFGWLVGRRILQ